MDYSEAYDIINNAKTHNFIVKTNTNKTEKKRLFVSTSNNICEFVKRSTKRGYLLNSNEIQSWISCTPVQSKGKEKEEVVKTFLLKVINYLEASGMWSNMLQDYKKIIELGDTFIKELVSADWSEQRKLLSEHNISSLYVDCIVTTAYKGIKCVNFDKYEKDYAINEINNIIKNKSSFRKRWRKHYDNSLEIQYDSDNIIRGWYAEEYKNCGNGHYYYLIDATHVIFSEDD